MSDPLAGHEELEEGPVRLTAEAKQTRRKTRTLVLAVDDQERINRDAPADLLTVALAVGCRHENFKPGGTGLQDDPFAINRCELAGESADHGSECRESGIIEL